MSHPALRLTPSHSPFFKNGTPRSPTKAIRDEEPGLQLRKVIGTTTTSVNGFDSLPFTRTFAYTAGACAVVCRVAEDLSVSQRFFRTRPTIAGHARDGNPWPASPTPNEPRRRALGHAREQSIGGSPLASAGRDWSDSPTGRSSSAKDRVKAATSVALSPNGKWLAVGETGYKPRVAIFSLAEGSSDSPVATLSEHSFGVHALRFSPDSRYLASLGTVNDGFLYIWSIDDKTGTACLHASNKLTVLINSMAWLGSTLVTVGLRFVKLWRPDEDASMESRTAEVNLGASQFLAPRHRSEVRSSDFGNSILSPKHKTLHGKNSLLGDLLECNFVAVIAVDDSHAVLCAESGEVCLLDDTHKAQTLILITTTVFQISAGRLDATGTVCVLGAEGRSKALEPADYFHPSRASSRTRRQSASPAKFAGVRSPSTIASSDFGGIVVSLSSESLITLSQKDAGNEDVPTLQLPAHRDAIRGVQCFRSNELSSTCFLTFSANGIVHFWDADGGMTAELLVPVQAAPSSNALANELSSVASSSVGSWIVAGDRYGVVTLIDTSSRQSVAQLRAHSAEIMDVTTFHDDGCDFVVTAGRDRMVQLFALSAGDLSLLQTMDEHAGAVTGVLYDQAGRRLLTHSADRTVVVREGMRRSSEDATSLAFAMVRTISLKASPTSMCLAGDGELLIATVDRCIGRYRLKSGHCNLNFKCSDAEGGEAAVISKVLFAPSLNGNPTITGVSSSDKSVRMYTEYGSLVARDWGHTEGITDIAIISRPGSDGSMPSDSPRLVTVAADSTIFIWDTISTPTSATNGDIAGADSTPDLLGTGNELQMGPPLRKIISHTELSRFRRKHSAGEGKNNNINASEPSSPNALTASPQRLRKKASRVSVAQPPRLEPAFRSTFAEPSNSRRGSLRHRSPSPPSPRNTARQGKTLQMRRRSMATLRSKSSDNVLEHEAAAPSPTAASPGKTSVFGSLAASTESLCRTLRAYRKRVAANQSDAIATEALQALEKELTLTTQTVAERSQGKTLDEMVMARLVEETSEKFLGVLDEKIRERVESEVRRSSGGAAAVAQSAQVQDNAQEKDVDAVSGALRDVTLEERDGA